MAKLGNDPFLRGAAPRVEKDASPPVPPAAKAKPPASSRKITAKPAAPKKPARAKKPAARAPSSHLVGGALEGKLARGAGPAVPHPPTPHASSPVLVEPAAPRPPTPHAASPVLVEPAVPRPPTPHAASPVLVEPAAPHPPTPHASSPVLVEPAAPRPPTPHASSPVLVEPAAPHPPTPHASSPVLVEPAAPHPPTPHASSPMLVEPDEQRPRTAGALSSSTPQPDAAEEASAYDEVASSGATLAHAEPSSLRARAAGALTVAREVVGQVFESPSVGRTVSAAEGLWRAAASAIGISASVDLDDYGRDSSLVSALQPVFDFFYERYWRVQVEGADHIPSGPVILVANHSGALPFDGPMVAQALARERADLHEARWLVEDQVFHAPFLGTLGNRLGAIRACPDNAVRLLGEGRPLIVFPEGIQGIGKTYRERYQLKRFGRGGFVKIALRTGAPIVPVAVVGAEESMPVLYKLPGGLFGLPYVPVTPLGPLPLPARWSIRFGEPLDLGGSSADEEPDLPRVQRLTERTRESIQGMLTALLKERASVF